MTDTPDTAQAPPTPAVMPGKLNTAPTPAAIPPSVPGAEPDTDTTEASQSLDESGFDPAAIGEIRKLRRESQRLRERLRTAETETERAVTQAEALRHREVERIAAEHLVDPSDVWSTGTDFTDPETGELDLGLVVEAAKSLTADKPHLARPSTAPPPSDRPVEGLRAGATPTGQSNPKPSWQSVIRPRTSQRLS